jgi:hypothetical protein
LDEPAARFYLVTPSTIALLLRAKGLLEHANIGTSGERLADPSPLLIVEFEFQVSFSGPGGGLSPSGKSDKTQNYRRPDALANLLLSRARLNLGVDCQGTTHGLLKFLTGSYPPPWYVRTDGGTGLA